MKHWYPIECEHGYDLCPICDSREMRMTKEVVERLRLLKANLAAEPDKNGLYAQDLKASIQSCENALKNDGYVILKGKK